MALTQADYRLWKDLRDSGLVPDRPAVLELGCANWYGDLDPRVLFEGLEKYATEPARTLYRPLLEKAVAERDSFTIARVFYGVFLNFRHVTAIDLHGPPECKKFDLNEPYPSKAIHEYDVTINSGTAEHVFNQYEFWRTCHACTKPGGLMVHCLPGPWGWLDHGFHVYQPTLVADLAHANGYEILRWVFVQSDPFRYMHVGGQRNGAATVGIGDIATVYGAQASALMYVVFRKGPDDRGFVAPRQGVYSERATRQDYRDWLKNR